MTYAAFSAGVLAAAAIFACGLLAAYFLRKDAPGGPATTHFRPSTATPKNGKRKPVAHSEMDLWLKEREAERK